MKTENLNCMKGNFYRTKPFQQHDNIHTGNKPHGCQYCAYRSGHYSNYLIHLRRKHGNWFGSALLKLK